LKKYGDSFGGIAAWEYYNSEPDTDEPWTWAAVMGLAMVNWKEVPQAAPLHRRFSYQLRWRWVD